MGRSLLAPEAMNCSAPDTGNMEMLTMFGTAEQKERWLQPLLEGEIRSCFAMTEPDVASSRRHQHRAARSTATATSTCINGRKWWISGAATHRCKVAIVMGKTDPDAPDPPAAVDGAGADGHARAHDRPRRCRCSATRTARATASCASTTCGCRSTNLLGEEGGGFAIAQARLGPGRIHHCMRCIGMAERALELMCRRVAEPGRVRQDRSPSRA